MTVSGSIIVQISDENLQLVRCLLDEVFGTENFCRIIPFAKTSSTAGDLLSEEFDYLIWYAKDIKAVKFRPLFTEKQIGTYRSYKYAEAPDKTQFRPLTTNEKAGTTKIDEGWRVMQISNIASQDPGRPEERIYSYAGSKYDCGAGKHWKTTNPTGLDRLAKAGRLLGLASQLNFRRYLDDFPAVPLTNLWDDTGSAGYSSSDPKIYVVQTDTAVIQRCILMTTDPGDLVLDPTCGAGTTAYVAEHWGRRWITIDTSRVALALARTRLMAARFPYYLLRDSAEGERQEAEIVGRVPEASQRFESDIKKEFVYKRVPHITLKSIANNDEIEAIHGKWQGRIAPLLKDLNRSLKKDWQEWQVPREAEKNWPDKVRKLQNDISSLRGERQKEMDAAIARRAETELLYDQPFDDPRKVRVTGPFTVESLSPHRVLPGAEQTSSEATAKRDDAPGQFETMILDNLRKAGVQTGRKGERLAFDALDSHAGTWIQGAGQYTRNDGTIRRVAVSLGPEHGTVGTEQIKEAAKEALKGAGFDELIICGFAFDALAGETAKEFSPQSQSKGGASIVAEGRRQFGKLQITLAKMNPDLAMGEDLLKSTGAGNLFMAFGEPDIAPLDKQTGRLSLSKDGKCLVELRGVDVYDPTTGQIRNSDAAEDVACWFIDTDYNGESFFVRHAYFTGGGEPYERLKRALRAEIDEAAWSAIYSTKSRPFDPPKSGKIALKVINHFGDEVLKVIEVETGTKKSR